MPDVITPIADVTVNSFSIILEQGIIGALLVLSIIGNIALVWALVRAYRWNSHQGRSL